MASAPGGAEILEKSQVANAVQEGNKNPLIPEFRMRDFPVSVPFAYVLQDFFVCPVVVVG